MGKPTRCRQGVHRFSAVSSSDMPPSASDPHASPFMGSALRNNKHKGVVPNGMTEEMQRLSYEADCAFRRRHGWTPGDREKLYDQSELHLMQKGPIPEVYAEYGITPHKKPTDREYS